MAIWCRSADLDPQVINEDWQLPLYGIIMSEIHSEKQVRAFEK